MADRETVLVTGASGFIGGWLVETMHLNRTAPVRAGIRSWSHAARLARFPVDIVLCNILDKEQIVQAMDGVTSVVHCVSGSNEAIIQGTNNVLEVALSKKIDRVVHLSSAAVYGDANGDIDETFPLSHTGNVYGDAKIEAEKLCWAYCERGLPVTVIRPSIVYGPFSTDWTLALAGRLQSGRWGLFKGSGEGLCNLIYVADLVSAILLILNQDSAVGQAFNLKGPDEITWNEYFAAFNAALHLPELRVIDSSPARLRALLVEPIRSGGKFVLAHFRGPLKKVSQRYRPARLALQYVDQSIRATPRIADLGLYNRQARYSTAKAQATLGFKPNYDLERGLRMTTCWLEHLGLTTQHAPADVNRR